MQRGTRMINRSFIREKVVHCGKNFLSPEIYPYSGQQQQAVGRKRGEKVNVSAPKQKNLNDRRAKRYFIQLANGNFGVGDLVVHLTYAPEFLPESEEEAAKIVAKYLRRVPGQRRNRGRPAAPGAEAPDDLLGQEDRYRIDADHQGKQPHRDGVPGDDAGGMECTVPEVRALSAPSLGQHRIRPARPEKGRAPQVRALRVRER